MLKRDTETLSEILGASNAEPNNSGTDLFAPKIFTETKYHETFRGKQSDDLALPSVVIPSNGDVEDFFATVATYYQGNSPLSPLVHVLSNSTASLLANKAKGINFRSSLEDRALLKASLGCVIGEAMLSRIGAPEVGDVTYAGCRRTFSFSLFRATLIHGAAFSPKELAERWVRLRRIARLRVLGPTIEAILSIHAIMCDIGEESAQIDRNLRDALRLMVKGADGSGQVQMALVMMYPRLFEAIDDLRGAFDGRMNAFLRIVDVIRTESRGAAIDEIAIAFFCNQILPGSFSHTSAIVKFAGAFPSAVIWYGFFAACSDVKSSSRVDVGLFAKLQRDLLDPFSFEQRPRCDISFEELEVLMRSSTSSNSLRPSQQRSLLVALLPGVDVYMRVEEEEPPVRSRRAVEAEELNERASRLIEEALYTLKKAQSIGRDDDSIKRYTPGKR